MLRKVSYNNNKIEQYQIYHVFSRPTIEQTSADLTISRDGFNLTNYHCLMVIRLTTVRVPGAESSPPLEFLCVHSPIHQHAVTVYML